MMATKNFLQYIMVYLWGTIHCSANALICTSLNHVLDRPRFSAECRAEWCGHVSVQTLSVFSMSSICACGMLRKCVDLHVVWTPSLLSTSYTTTDMHIVWTPHESQQVCLIENQRFLANPPLSGATIYGDSIRISVRPLA